MKKWYLSLFFMVLVVAFNLQPFRMDPFGTTFNLLYAQVSETTSYLRLDQGRSGQVPADGVTPCTVQIFVYSETSSPLIGFQITAYTTRGLSYDTITYPYGQLTDSNGACTATIVSSYFGGDTVTAFCEGATITENIVNNPSFELGSGPPTSWSWNGVLWKISADTYVSGVQSITQSCTIAGDTFTEARWTGTKYADKWPITSSTSFFASQYCKTDNLTSNTARIRIIWFKDAAVITEVNTSTLSGTNPWTLMSATVTSPATANGLMYRCQQSGAGTAWFDTVRLRRVPTLNWTASALKITTTPFTTTINNPSSFIAIQVQDLAGNTDSSFSSTATLTSSSGGGKFSVDRISWADTSIITLSGGLGKVYYKDSISGNPVITISRAGYTPDTQTETILDQDVNETASYITFTPYQILADGTSVCSVAISINDTYGFPIVNKLTTLQMTRGNSDTINDSMGGDVNPQTTDVNGVCTFTLKSNYSGWDTLTAIVDGKTITRGVNKYGAVGVWHFDTDVKDVSGYNNNCIMGGNTAPLWTSVPDSAAQGCALQFDGADDYLEIPTSSSLNITDAITIELWAKQAKANSNGNLIFAGAGSFDYGVWIQGGKFIGGIWNVSATQYSPYSTMTPNVGQWYHVAMTYDSNNDTVVRVYVDGTLNNTAAGSGKIRTGHTALEVGGKYPNSWYFNGIIDEIKIYNRALSAAEIKASYGRRANIYFIPNTLKITSPQRTTGAGVVSDSITVEAQDGGGVKDATFNSTVTLISSSSTGRFSTDKTNWSSSNNSSITLSSGSGYFYYKDSAIDSPVITISRAGYYSCTQTVNVTQSYVSETTSYLTTDSSLNRKIPANGSSVCTVTIVVKDILGNSIFGKQVNLSTSRGSAYDTITYPGGQITDVSGQCIALVSSSYAGEDTITASSDGVTITENVIPNPSFEEGSGSYPSNWSFAGSWAWATGEGYSGNRAIRCLNNSVSDSYARSSKSSVSPNSKYFVTCWIKTESYSDTPSTRAVWYKNGSISATPTSDWRLGAPGTNEWTLCSVTATSPSDAFGILFSADAKYIGTIWYDAVRVRRVPTINFTASKLKITSPQRTVAAGSSSESIAIEARDNLDNKDNLFGETVSLYSSSAGGKFSVSNTAWQNITFITFANGSGIFYYKDSFEDSPIITVSRTGMVPDTQTVSVSAPTISETASYINVNTFTVPANGTAKCTVTVIVKNLSGTPLGSRQVTVVTSRGSSADTVSYPYGNLTDVNGMCTATIVSSTGGEDTITAICDGCTITNFYGDVFDDMEGTNGSARWTPSGTWQVESGEYSGASGITTVTAKTAKDFTLIVDYTVINTLTSDNWGGIRFHKTTLLDDMSTGYLNYYRYGGNFCLYKCPGQYISGLTAPDPYLITRRVKIEKTGTSMKTYVDGTNYLNWTDSSDTPYLSGYTSFRISNIHAHWDNLRIYPVKINFVGADKIAITTPSRSMSAGVASDSIVVKALWNDGSFASGYSETCAFSSSSYTGMFAPSQSGPWSSTFTARMVSGETTVYYKDTKVGSPTITVSSGSLPNTTQLESVGASSFNETSSYIVLSTNSIPQDGVTPCTVTVYVTDKYRNPLSGKAVAISSSRTDGTDTITQPSAVADENGIATGSLVSSAKGTDTITAVVDGQTITLTFYQSRPVAMWDFDEGEGIVASSHGPFSGVTQNSPTWTTGKYGSSLNFVKTSSQRVQVPDTDALDITDKLTLEAWVNVTSDTGYLGVLTKSGAYMMRRDSLSEGNDPSAFVYISGGGEPRAGTGVSMNDGQWYHLVATFDKDIGTNNLKIYVNGSFGGQATRAGTLDVNANPVYLGTSNGGTNYFNGLIDDIRIYNRVISTDEISAYSQGRQRPLNVSGIPFRLKITTPARAVFTGSASDSIVVEVQDNGGEKVSSFNDTITVTSTSSNGRFSADKTNWSTSNDSSITLTAGSATFYYRDTNPGVPVITVSRASLQPDSQTVTVNAATFSTVNSYLRLHPSLYGQAPADGITACTITVLIADEAGTPIFGKQITLSSSRGTNDTITYPAGQATDANGICTAVIISSYSGDDTITALCDGTTITENILNNPSFELGSSPPTNWVFGTKSGIWSVSTNTAAYGVRSVTHSCTAGDDNYFEARWTGITYVNEWPIKSNTKFYATQYTKSDSLALVSGYGAYIRVIWFKDTSVLGEAGSSSLSGTQPWAIQSVNLTSPSTANGLMFRCENRGAGTAWYDAVRLQRVPTITWTGAEKIAITTPSRSITAGSASDSITVKAQFNNGAPALSYNETCAFSSSSYTGMFAPSQSGPWSATLTARMVSGETYVYYKDTKVGSPTITVSSGSLPNTTQLESVGVSSFNETSSYIVLSTRSIPQDGITPCTITVYVTDKYRNPLSGKAVAISSSRTDGTDTITQPSAVADANGITTGSLVSSAKGIDTITAIVDGQTITLVFYQSRPVAMWDFDEGEGIVVSSYGPFSGVTQNSPAWAVGKYGSCLSFVKASSQRINVPDTDALDITDKLTMEAWVNVTSDTGYLGVLSKSGAYMMRRDSLSEGNDPSAFVYISGGAEPRAGTGVSMNDGQWYHLVATFDKDIGTNNLKIYVNGSFGGQATRAGTLDVNANPVYLGTSNGGTNYFNGLIDDIRIYNRVISTDEISAYSQGRQRPLTISGIPFKLKITTPARTAVSGSSSDSIAFEVQDSTGEKVTSFSDTITLKSSSTSGRFSVNQTNWSSSNDTFIMVTNGGGIIYYRDTSPGASTVTISRSGLQSDTQIVTITPAAISQSTSYLRTPLSLYGRFSADGISGCSVTVLIADATGTPIFGKYVTVYTSRGSSYDTVTYPAGQTTDANGICTAVIVSGYAGQDTFTATCDGNSITENMVNNPGFELGTSPPTGWNFSNANGTWSVVTDVTHSCSRAIRHVATAAGDAYTATPEGASANIYCYPGSGFYTSAWVKCEGATGSPRIRFIWWSQTGTYVAEGYYNTPNITGTTDWTYVYGTGTVPANAYRLSYRCQNSGAGTVWFDDVSVRRVPTLNWTASKLVFKTPALRIKAGSVSSEITIAAQGNTGNTDVLFNETASLSTSSESGSFSSSANPWSDISYVTFSSGKATFYYRDYRIGTPVLTISRTGYSTGVQSETITASQLSFVLSAFTISAGQISDTVIVSAQDSLGNTDTNWSETVSLVSSSTVGKFSVSRTAWADTSVIKFSSGVTSFFYRDKRGGSPAITVTSSDLSAAQNEVVIIPVITITKSQRNERLSSEATSSSIVATSGDTVEWTLTILNSGNETAVNLIIWDTMAFDTSAYTPAYFVSMDTSYVDSWTYTVDPSYLSWQPYNNSPAPEAQNVKGLRWRMNTLGPNEQKAIKFRVRMK